MKHETRNNKISKLIELGQFDSGGGMMIWEYEFPNGRFGVFGNNGDGHMEFALVDDEGHTIKDRRKETLGTPDDEAKWILYLEAFFRGLNTKEVSK